MRPPWSTRQQILALTAMVPIGSLVAMPLRVTPTLVELSSVPLQGWTSLALSWWLPPLLSLPAIIALVTALSAPSPASRRRSLVIALLAGWAALTGILAGVVAVLVA